MGELTLLLWLKSNKEKELVWAYNSHATVTMVQKAQPQEFDEAGHITDATRNQTADKAWDPLYNFQPISQ